MLELSKNLKKIRNPVRLDSLTVISYDCFKNHVVWLVVIKVFKFSGDTDSSFFLVVFDCVLDDVEDDKLVQPPVRLHRWSALVSCHNFDIHLFFLYLVLKWLQYLLNEFLWFERAHFFHNKLSFFYFHFFKLICVIELKDLGGIHDLLIHVKYFF